LELPVRFGKFLRCLGLGTKITIRSQYDSFTLTDVALDHKQALAAVLRNFIW